MLVDNLSQERRFKSDTALLMGISPSDTPWIMTILIRLSDYPFHLAAVACGEHFAWLEDNFLVNKTRDKDSRRYCRYPVMVSQINGLLIL